jgi:hypothetical protein
VNHPNPSLSVNVDVTNPGQFFACCGLLELAHRLWPGAEAWFENGRFCLACNHGRPDLKKLLEGVVTCPVDSVATSDAKTAPISLGDPIGMQLDWWLRADGSANLFKTWAANATSKQMFCKWCDPLKGNMSTFITSPEDLLTVSVKKQGSYGFDSDLGWDALGVGFSLNEHAGLKELPTRPAVELLGAIGLQRFFPLFKEKEQVLEYATWRVSLRAPVARVAALGAPPVVATHRMRTRFVYRGSFKGLDRATIIQGESDE